MSALINSFKILTDSSGDLSPELIEKYGLEVIPLTLDLDGKTHLNYPDGREIGFEDFYSRLRGGAACKTSAVNIDAFEKAMDTILADGHDLLYIGFSSGLSATFGASRVAADEMRKKYPERKIIVVDSLCASMGEGLLTVLAAREKDAGKSIEEVAQYVEDNKLHLCHWFTVDDLHHLKRGGRVSPTTALLGTMLKIKPVMHVDNEGKLIVVSKERGRKNAIKALLDHMEQTIINPDGHTVFISHGDCFEDAELLSSMIREKFPKIGEIVINYIGPVIGSHSGPGTLALFFLGTSR